MHQPLPNKTLLQLWLPLLATWLMMGLEGPIVSALIARQPEVKINLAAYGVSLAMALIMEAPVIMLMSASTALVRDRSTYLSLRRYMLGLLALMTGCGCLFLFPPAFTFLTDTVLHLPVSVQSLVYQAAWCFTPWPVAIGFRRFYQGLLIRSGATHQVTIGTVVRLTVMLIMFPLVGAITALPGAATGAVALSSGVVAEALLTRILARRAIAAVLATPATSDTPLTVKAFGRFYLPLMLTAFLSLAIQPLVTFFVGQAPAPLESLAVLPVINGLIFVFRCVSLSMQELMVAVLAAAPAMRPQLRLFVQRIATVVAACLALMAFTPVSSLWFARVAGLSSELTHFAVLPFRINTLVPLLSLALSFLTAMAIHSRHTRPLTVATALEVGAIALTLAAGVTLGLGTGALIACLALVVGRSVNVLVLWRGARTS